TEVYTYTLSDGEGGFDTATVTITINGTNDVPVATNDAPKATNDGLSVTEGTTTAPTEISTTALTGVLANDTDVDTPHDQLIVTDIRTGSEAGSGTDGTLGTALTGTYGTLTLYADGHYTYALDNTNPTVDALNTDSTPLHDVFTYTMSDGALTDQAELTITINGTNDGPVATPDGPSADDDGLSVTEGTTTAPTEISTTALTGVLANDTDVDTSHDQLIVTDIRTGSEAGSGTDGTLGTALTGTYGTLTLYADGHYTYALDNTNPTVDALNTDSTPLHDVFTYTMSDGALTDQAELTITINGTNDGPVATPDGPSADDDGLSVTEGTTTAPTEISTTALTGVLANDTDVDTSHDQLIVTDIRTGSEAGSGTDGTLGTALTGTYGTLTLYADGHYTYALDNTNPTVDALNTDSTPLHDVFTYTMSDGALTDQAELTITINGTNDGPVATPDGPSADDDGLSVTEGTTTAPTEISTTALTGVLANDTDVDTSHDQLIVTDIRTGSEAGSGTDGTLGTALTGTYGTLTLYADGHYTYALDNTNPTVDALNTDSTPLHDVFTYTMSDGALTDQAELTITINGTNDGPVATPDGPSADDDGLSVTEGTTTAPTEISTTALTGVLANDTDVDTSHDQLIVTDIRTGSEAGSGTDGTLGTALTGTYGTLTLYADGHYT